MDTGLTEDYQQQIQYWEERAHKAEQRLQQHSEHHQRRQEALTNQLAQAESRCNILQAEVERLHMLLEGASTFPQAAPCPPGEVEERLRVAEERARLFESELKEVHYKVADRMLKEPAEHFSRGFEFHFEQALPVPRVEQLLDQYYRTVAYAEALRQGVQQLSEREERLSQEVLDLQRSLKTGPSEPPPESADAELQRLAFEDRLTGLPNLALATRFLEQELARVQQAEGTLILGVFDPDGLRSINLTLGSETGDEILKGLAGRLKGRLRSEEVLARGRDDEFLVVTTLPVGGADGLLAAQQAGLGLAQRLLGELQTPLVGKSHQLQISGACGLVISQGKEDLRLLMDRALLSLKKAKREGRNRVQLYAPSLEEGGRRRVQLAQQLQQALELEQIGLQFQPVVELASGKVWGVEALLRWNHPQLGTLEPAQFIDIALESGLIVPLGEWVVQESTKMAAQLEQLHLSLNLSAQELMQADFVRRFTKLLELSHVTRPDRLILEVPEKEFGPEADRIASSLKELRRWGIQVAIDDFTFDSLSLRRVQQLEVGHIKLDQVIVHHLDNPLCEGLARAAVQVGTNLKCRIWAEGIETAAQLQQLKAMGVQLGQGNALCPPLPVGALRERLRAGK